MKARNASRNSLPRHLAAITLRQWAQIKRVVTDLYLAARGAIEKWSAAPPDCRNMATENRDGRTAGQSPKTDRMVKQLLIVAREEFEKEKLEAALKKAQKEFDVKFAGSPKQKKLELQRLLDAKFAEARNVLARKLKDEGNPGPAEKAQEKSQSSVVSLTGRLFERREARTIKSGRPGASDATARGKRGRRHA